MTKTLIAVALASSAWAGIVSAQTATMPDTPPQRPYARGPMTRADATARADMMFDRMDRNRDGKLTPDELIPPPPPPGADGAMLPARGGGRQGARMFERLDANHDGSVSREEYRAQALARFDRIDTNHDGVIDPAEREAARSFAQRRGGLGRPARSGAEMAPPAPMSGDQAPGQ